jgi:chromosome segregation protein
MLKRLELVGFKSFADKTAFDFAPGITAIVGPNGSGKSNIVDAVRWVLGEQSAKSLRGGEMADVIFNGSASRRSLGMAEVTMTFDNSRGALAIASEEVQISRRVYRSGEGEYLINGQICRLKDVKDLFLGSGAGADAYCIIEQGRVDVLLQASTRERRTIFEEAAGISRFRVKKTETLRRLDRVDQNLARLRDILDEVEKQLRNVKLQAAKAQRYQEYSEQLKQLRVRLGLGEYGQLTGKLEQESSLLEGLRTQLEEQVAQADLRERRLLEIEAELGRVEAAVHEQEARLGAARQQIATEDTTLAHGWDLAADLEMELAQTRLRLAELGQHVAALAEAEARISTELHEVEAQCQAQRDTAQRHADQLQAVEARLAHLGQQVQEDDLQHLDCMRQSGRLKNDAISYKGQVDNLRHERNRLLHRSEQAAEHLATLDVELRDLRQAEEEVQGRLGGARQALAEVRQERDRLRLLRDETTQLAANLRAQHSGVASRIEVLEGLERSHEGLGSGPREVFALLEQGGGGPWQTVLGIVADVLTVRREYAPLIDLALGERAQRFLVRDVEQLALALRQRGQSFSSRVSFLPISAPAAPAPQRRTRVSPGEHVVAGRQAPLAEGVPSHPGIVALAEQVVRCDDPQLADLPRRLLANTLVVSDLAAAYTLARMLPGFRFVTLQGELLEVDGTLTVGTHHAETGILSRKSELRELRDQAVELEGRVAAIERDLTDLRESIALLDGRAENAQQEIDVLAEQLSDLRSRLGQCRQRRDGLHAEVQDSRGEISGLERDIASLEAQYQQACSQAAHAEAQVQLLHARLESARREIREHESQRKQRGEEALAVRVALAKVEERLASLRGQQQRIEQDLRQRQQERQQSERHRDATRDRLQENQQVLLRASSLLAEAYLRKEAAERALASWEQQRSELRQQRQECSEQAQVSRDSWRIRQEQAHARELVVNELRHRRDTLCSRLQEDYQIDLSALHAQGETASEAPADDPEAPAPEQQIEELRRKLSRLGSVNIEAIQELADLEARASGLQIQLDDLNSAQRSLQDIINRINNDSRRLFQETFQAIRLHFQELFRKLFGGGMADIVLEDPEDVLETGIEVVARPPGKELRSISLMSGGEKTMTAVALLLAIFESKPSPFCLLDEVDAALDEANIGRFTSVLRDFLDRSQFIIITHSKRTMACADVLYGISMQESGISRRFSVRFEDWPDEEAEPQSEAG